MNPTAIKKAINHLPRGQIETGILLNEDFQNCGASSRRQLRQQVYSNRRGIISRWRRYGLSETCPRCRLLTPLRYMQPTKTANPHEHVLICKKCREKTSAAVLPAVPPQSNSLRRLNYMEQRLVAMAQVSQYLIDMPSGGPRGQWGRMYITPLKRPRLSSVIENCRLDRHGKVYVHSPNGEVDSHARVRELYHALEKLYRDHRLYKIPEVRAAIRRLQQKNQYARTSHIRKKIKLRRQDRNSATCKPMRDTQQQAMCSSPVNLSSSDSDAIANDSEANSKTCTANATEKTDERTGKGLAHIEYVFPEAPTAPFADTYDLGEQKLMANLMTDADVKVFPHLFPTGEYGYNPDIKFADYTRQRLLGADQRFEDCPDYIYFLLETWLKKRISSNTSVRISQQKQSSATHPTEALRKQVYTTLRDVPGTQPYVFAKKGVALSMFEQLGTPQWFLTLTCHAKQAHVLIACIYAKLLRGEHAHKQPLNTKTRKKLAAWIYANYMDDPNYKWYANKKPNEQVATMPNEKETQKTPHTNNTPNEKRSSNTNDNAGDTADTANDACKENINHASLTNSEPEKQEADTPKREEPKETPNTNTASEKKRKTDENDNPEAKAYTANELCNSMPAIVARQFFQQVKRFLRWLSPTPQDGAEDSDAEQESENTENASTQSSENNSSDEATTPKTNQYEHQKNAPHARHKWPCPFHVHDYIVRVEWQKRGYPHVHMLLWTQERVQPSLLPTQLSADDVEHLTDDEVADRILPCTVEDLTDKFICTTTPERWKNVHLKRRPERADYKCLSSLASLQAHNCNQYCRRYAGNLQYCRFGYPHAPEPRARRRTAKEQWSRRVKSSIAVRRHPGTKLEPHPLNGIGTLMGQYNKNILLEWQSSTDLQPICELTMASRYILGYTFKSEEDIVAARRVERLLEQFIDSNDPFHQATYKIAHASTQARTASTFEACHLLLGFPVVLFSRDHIWIQTGRPQTWTLWVRPQDIRFAITNPDVYASQHANELPAAQQRYANIQESMPDTITDIPVEADGITTTRRPWREISFFDYCAGFQRGQPRGATPGPLPRKRPAIVGHRQFSPDTDTEDYYFSKLLLHHVWKTPGDWLKPEDGGRHTRAFTRIVSDRQTYPHFMSSICYPSLNNTIAAAREIQRVQATMYLKASIRSSLRGWTLSRFDQDKYKDSIQIMQCLRNRNGRDFDFDAPDNVPSGVASDAFAPVEAGEAYNAYHNTPPIATCRPPPLPPHLPLSRNASNSCRRMRETSRSHTKGLSWTTSFHLS